MLKQWICSLRVSSLSVTINCCVWPAGLPAPEHVKGYLTFTRLLSGELGIAKHLSAFRCHGSGYGTKWSTAGNCVGKKLSLASTFTARSQFNLVTRYLHTLKYLQEARLPVTSVPPLNEFRTSRSWPPVQALRGRSQTNTHLAESSYHLCQRLQK